MVLISLPRMAALLLPIILIEALYVKYRLNLPVLELLKKMGVANLISTSIGIPVTWALLSVFNIIVTEGGKAYSLDDPLEKLLFVTVQAPWLLPFEEGIYWMIPAAEIVLLVPFFFVSCWSEYIFLKMVFPFVDRKPLKRIVFGANVYSYVFLVLMIVFLGARFYIKNVY